jgi:hypothetical protein
MSYYPVRSDDEMKGFYKLLLGFLLVLFTFRVGGVDVLPGFIGFVIVYLGLGDLADREPGFVEARKYTMPLALISLFFFVQLDLGLLTMALAVVYAGVTLLTLWHIFKGITNLAVAAEQTPLAQAAMVRWKYYLVLTILTLASPLLLFLGPLLLVLILAGFVVNVLLLMTFYQAGQVLA